jgi:hypothetical protein
VVFFFFGMWEFLNCHKSAYEPRSVWCSGAENASVYMCRSHFLPHPQHGAMQFLVDVNVALHRAHINPHMRKHIQLLCHVPPPLYKAVKGRFNL